MGQNRFDFHFDMISIWNSNKFQIDYYQCRWTIKCFMFNFKVVDEDGGVTQSRYGYIFHLVGCFENLLWWLCYFVQKTWLNLKLYSVLFRKCIVLCWLWLLVCSFVPIWTGFFVFFFLAENSNAFRCLGRKNVDIWLNNLTMYVHVRFASMIKLL